MITISFPYLFYGFIFGLIILSLFYKKNKVFIQYPTPHNVGKVIYKDLDNKCFKYKAIRTQCATNNQVILPNV
jgi:hypothetical protein